MLRAGIMANSTTGLHTYVHSTRYFYLYPKFLSLRDDRYGLPGMALADVRVYGGPLSAAQLSTITAAAVPPPAPTPPAPPRPAPSPDLPPGWPVNNYSDAPDYYSFNPHGHDRRGPQGSTRRLMFGWIRGGVSAAVASGKVPYWQSAHSLMRSVTVAGASIVQRPATGSFEPLRTSATPVSVGPISVAAGGSGYLPTLRGDALEIRAVFSTKVRAQSFGLALRVGDTTSCKVGYTPATKTLNAPGENSWRADITPQPSADTVSLRIFLDRSIIETYTGGAALTSRCLLPRGVTNATATDLWSVGGQAQLVSLQAWHLGSMWGDVTARD